MTVKELIEKLQEMPDDAVVNIYDETNAYDYFVGDVTLVGQPPWTCVRITWD